MIKKILKYFKKDKSKSGLTVYSPREAYLEIGDDKYPFFSGYDLDSVGCAMVRVISNPEQIQLSYIEILQMIVDGRRYLSPNKKDKVDDPKGAELLEIVNRMKEEYIKSKEKKDENREKI